MANPIHALKALQGELSRTPSPTSSSVDGWAIFREERTWNGLVHTRPKVLCDVAKAYR
jgi:hypothetical protein